MRICLHTFWEVTHDFIGGTERFLIELSKELKSLGYAPYILCTGAEARYTVEGVEVVADIPDDYKGALAHFGSAKPAFLKAEFIDGRPWKESLQRLSGLVQHQLDRQNADIFHLNSFAAASFVDLPGPTIVTNHENAQESDHLWGDGFFDFLVRTAAAGETRLHNHAALAVPSRYYASEYATAMGIPVQPVKQGIRLDTFPSMMSRTRRGIPETLRLLLPSRFEPHQKGHDLAVQACGLLASQGIGFELIFSGIRDDHAGNVALFQNLIRREGISDNVRMMRFAEIQEAYAICDIVLSPERYCSYGLSVSESLALGVPTVLSDIPTYHEIASGYAHAYFFHGGCAEALAEAILLARSELSQEMPGEAIRFRIANDLRECAKVYSDLYRGAVGL